MKKIPFIFIVLFILVAIFLRLGSTTKTKGPEKISDVIWKMFSTAKLADTTGYLNCFSAQALDILQSTRKEMEDAQFRNYLMKFAKDIKGISVIGEVPAGPEKMSFEVEVVYPDRNEYQNFSLQKISDEWKIDQISRPVIKIQPIPYMELVVKE